MILKHGMEADKHDFLDSFEDSELGRIYFLSRSFREETFREFQTKDTLLKAVSDGRTVGFICYIPNGAFHSFPLIHILTILPDFRGRGLGKRILEQFEGTVLKKSSKVFLVVADFNPAAKRFYERCGYVQVGTVPDLYRPGIDEFLMMKDLTAARE